MEVPRPAVIELNLNQKRSEICKLETDYEMEIHIVTVADMAWDAVTIEGTTRRAIPGPQAAPLSH